MDRWVYLDNNGTTRTADEVLEFMRENSGLYGNASSMHTLGRNAAAGIDWARQKTAMLIGALPEEIYFTSGATESNNTVLNIFRDRTDDGDKRSRIIISSVEHPASIESAKYLRKKGYKVDLCPVDHSGRVIVHELEKLMGDDVAISVLSIIQGVS